MNAIEALAEKFGIVIDWSNQNVVPYLNDLMHRIVSFEIVTSILFIIFGIMFIVSVKLWRKAIRFTTEQLEEHGRFSDWGFGVGASWVGACGSVGIGIIMIMYQIWDLIRCVMLPEAVLISHITSYMPK